MDSRPDGGPHNWRSLFDKRAALVLIVVGAVLFGVGFSVHSTNNPGPTQYAATDRPSGATASISADEGESVSVDFDGTTVASAGNVSLHSLNMTFDGGGQMNLTGVSRETTTTAAEAPTNDTVSYLNVSHRGNAEIDSVTFTFTLQKSVVEPADVTPGSVMLYRLNDDSWQNLETSLRSEDADSYTFKAVSPGLSVFAISLSSAETNAEAPGTPTPTPTATPSETVTEATTPASNQTATEIPTTTPNETETLTPESSDPPDPPESTDTFTGSLSLNPATAGPITSDTGDVDAVAGTLAGTLSWSDSRATRAVLTVSVDSPAGSDSTIREVPVNLSDRTALPVDTALGADKLLFASGERANEYAVGADGAQRQYEQVVTVSVTIYERSSSLVSLSETTTLTVVVENAASDGSVDGESNPDTD